MEQKDSIATLEEPSTEVKGGANASNSEPTNQAPKKPTKIRFRSLTGFFNVYLFIFIILVMFVIGFTYYSYMKEKRDGSAQITPTQELSPEALKQLRNSDTSVGDAKQTLTVQSNSIFTGKVLVRNDVEIAGTLNVGGTLNLSGLIVSGITSLDQIQGNKLNITGDSSIQGQLTVQKGLTISGGASFGAGISAPTITVETLQLSGDLLINRHIDAGGTTPTGVSGAALGSGGTASVSGTDTAGTIAINTGSSPAAGCFITITFAKSFNAQPHIVVSPVGSVAGNLNYYINRATNGFSLCTANSAAASSNFSFDYIVID